MFLPATRLRAPGTLRTALCYPCPTGEFETGRHRPGAGGGGSGALAGALDTTERWDRQLNDDEKQSFALARVMLQRPQWVVMNEAFEASRSGVSADGSRRCSQVSSKGSASSTSAREPSDQGVLQSAAAPR